MRMRTDSYVSGTGLMQSFLEAGINLNHHDRSFLPWVAPAPMERREKPPHFNRLGRQVNMNRPIQQKAPRGHASKNMLEGSAEWPGLQCNAQPWVSNGEVLVISLDLSSIIFTGNVRTALTNNVWNHFQLFAFQVSLLRSSDISRLTGGAIREKI